ncbi:MAG: hypothetical protein Q4D23_11045 [Bacteroidales bacterium]|nr:hypothetical protein [Bacteroidales bacterium]
MAKIISTYKNEIIRVDKITAVRLASGLAKEGCKHDYAVYIYAEGLQNPHHIRFDDEEEAKKKFDEIKYAIQGL